MKNLIDIVNRTRNINAEIKTLRQQPNMTLADFRRLALRQADLLELCPPQRYIWLGGRPIIDLFCELARPMA